MSRRIRIVEFYEDNPSDVDVCRGLDGCEEVLEELLYIAEKLVSLRLAGIEPDEVELMELLYIAEDLYRCVNGDGHGAEDCEV